MKYSILLFFLIVGISQAATNYVLVVSMQTTQEVTAFTTTAPPPPCSPDLLKAFMQVTYPQYTNDLSLSATNKLKNIPKATITNALYVARRYRKSQLADYEDWKNLDKESLIALVKVLLDEDNRWRGWLMDFKTATSNATSLADFKTRVNALDTLPQINRVTMTNAIQNKL